MLEETISPWSKWCLILSMTHVPEIGAENPYHKTGTKHRHENKALSYSHSLPKTDTRKKSVPNCIPDAPETGGTGFRRRFLVRVTLA